MANGPYRTVPMQIPTLRNTVRPVQLGAGQPMSMQGLMAPATTAGRVQSTLGMVPTNLRTRALQQATAPTTRAKSQAELLAAYGLGRKPAQTVGGERRGAGAPAAKTGMSDMLPAVGTPEMAGLGAAGRTLMQLGGWQDKPMTLGQILGAGAEKGIEAMQARRDAMAAAEEKKAAAERQAKQDELSRRNIESQIEARDRPAGAVSAAGKFATDMGFTPGTKEHIAAMQNYIKKEKATGLTALQKEAEAIFPDDPKAAASWVKDRRERPRGTVQKAGVVLDDTGKRVGRAIFNPTPKEGEGYVSVIDDSGKTRPLDANERSVEDALIKDMVVPQEKFYALEKEVKQSKQSIRKLDSYLENIGKSKEGVGRTVDQFITFGKTFFSELLPEEYKNLKPSELARAIAAGELQGLIGSSRLEVVGGGVMTEQDALRIIEYLGGDVTALQNKEVVEAQIKKILKEKAEMHNIMAKQYNEQRAFRGGRGKTIDLVDMGRFEALDRKPETTTPTDTTSPVTAAPSGVEAEVWAVMTPEERALFND